MAVTLLPTPKTVPDAIDVAWARVADGYAAALDVDGLPERHRGVLTRQLRRAQALAGRPPLAVAVSESQLYPLGIDDPTRGGA